MIIVHVQPRPYEGRDGNEAYDSQFCGASFDRYTCKLSVDELDDLCGNVSPYVYGQLKQVGQRTLLHHLADRAGILCDGVQEIEHVGAFVRFVAIRI